MPRLNIERQQQLEPKRMKFAVEQLTKMGYTVTHNNTTLEFIFKGETVRFYPYSGWHAGKTIKDGRGWDNLKPQLIVKDKL